MGSGSAAWRASQGPRRALPYSAPRSPPRARAGPTIPRASPRPPRNARSPERTIPMAFQQLDYFQLDDQFSEDERMVRDTVRAWVGERYLPLAMQHFEAGTFPQELTPELAELGVFGPTVPQEYGGAGLNAVAYGLICQELERGDSGLRSFVSVQGSLVMYPILAYGSEAQK